MSQTRAKVTSPAKGTSGTEKCHVQTHILKHRTTFLSKESHLICLQNPLSFHNNPQVPVSVSTKLFEALGNRGRGGCFGVVFCNSPCRRWLYGCYLLVFTGVGGYFSVVVQPLEFQGPAAFGKARKDQSVSFQVGLGQAWFCLEEWCNIPWNTKERNRFGGYLGKYRRNYWYLANFFSIWSW